MKTNLLKKALLISLLAFGYCLPAGQAPKLHTYDYLMRVAKLVQSAGSDTTKKIIGNLDALAGKNAGYNFRQILKVLEIELKTQKEATSAAKPASIPVLPQITSTAAAAAVRPEVFAGPGVGPSAPEIPAGGALSIEPIAEILPARGEVAHIPVVSIPGEIPPAKPQKTIDIYFIEWQWPMSAINSLPHFASTTSSPETRQKYWKEAQEKILAILQKEHEISTFEDLRKTFKHKLDETNQKIRTFFTQMRNLALTNPNIAKEVIQYLTEYTQLLAQLKEVGLSDIDATFFLTLRKELNNQLKIYQIKLNTLKEYGIETSLLVDKKPIVTDIIQAELTLNKLNKMIDFLTSETTKEFFPSIKRIYQTESLKPERKHILEKISDFELIKDEKRRADLLKDIGKMINKITIKLNDIIYELLKNLEEEPI